MKNCIRPPYEKLKPPTSGFIENSNFENNRDPCHILSVVNPNLVYIAHLQNRGGKFNIYLTSIKAD